MAISVSCGSVYTVIVVVGNTLVVLGLKTRRRSLLWKTRASTLIVACRAFSLQGEETMNEGKSDQYRNKSLRRLPILVFEMHLANVDKTAFQLLMATIVVPVHLFNAGAL